MPRYDLLVFSHLRWGFVYQRPQHLLTRAARDRRVFFVEEPVFHDAPAEMRVRLEQSNVVVCTPHLPADLDDVQKLRAQKELLTQLMVDQEIRRYVAWYYTPMAVSFTRDLRPLAMVYDCMDELSAFAGAPKELRDREGELFDSADLVFTGGASLYEAKRQRHRSVHCFPSSVDAEHFRRARAVQDDPDDQSAIPRPRLGFYGVIDERLDKDLIRDLAALRPEWQIVLVGPVVKIDPASLPVAPNIHYLGAKSYDELPVYASGWDVAVMPFAHNESTRFISPTKTPEYLAAGLPVVSTSIRDVVSGYGEAGLVRIADDAADFVAACEEAMIEDEDARLANVDEILAKDSWELTWRRMERLIDGVVLQRRATVRVPRAEPRRAEPTPSVTVVEDRQPPDGFDYLIVGAGYAGSVIAERLATQDGKRVLVVDKRNHIAGNAYDHYDDACILVHRYGPHIFHTNSAEVFDYLSQFTKWRPYQHRVRASVDGMLLPMPINLDTINEMYGMNLTSQQVEDFLASVAEPVGEVRTSEDVVVKRVGRELYEKFFRNYTRKQWGLDPSELDATVTARVPVRTNRDDRYFTDKYQAMPRNGYTRMFERMLDHPNIKVMLNTSYREVARLVRYKEIVYTGPVDEYFDYKFGKLPYRSLEFQFETHDRPRFQDAPVVNYPNENPYTRITEFKYLTGQEHPKTSIVYEIPRAEGDPYYPVPRPENAKLYKMYKELAEATPGVHFIGRLATYKYYNMDQVVAQALATHRRMTGRSRNDEVQKEELDAGISTPTRAVGRDRVHA